MKITEVEIGKLKPYANNPRVISDLAVEKIAQSLQEFGFRQPIVVDPDDVVIAGHTRLLAAKKLGMKKVPIHVADLSPEKAAAYRLLDNKLNELADWDSELVDIELEKLTDLDLGLLELFNDIQETNEISAFDELIAGDVVIDHENAGKHGDWVTLSFVMPPEERDMVQEALRNVQNQEGLMNTTQSLIKIAKDYL